MGLFDSLKSGVNNISRSVSIQNKIEKGELELLTEEERTFYTDFNKMTPEEYLAKWELKQTKKAETQLHIGGLDFRKDGEGLYYFGTMFNPDAERYLIVDFVWDGPQYNLISKTTGKNKTKGRAGSALIGAAIAGPTGAIVGASLGRKTKVNTSTVTEQQEKDSVAFLVFESVDTGIRIQKKIKCNSDIATEIRELTLN